MQFKQYPSYKNSGVEWLGGVPEHWGMNRLGVHFRNRKEKVSDKDFKPLSVTKHGIVPQLEHAAKSDNGDNRKLVRKGDYVINSRSDRKGSSGLADLDGSVSLINIVLTPFKTIHPKFSHYLLRSYLFQEEFYKYGHGIVADLWTTNYEDMRNIHLALPSVSEQTQIASFLDYETFRIDNLIAKQEKLIELLEEQRKSIISHAVTKGLNPNAPMKDSGVEWLGEVPEHWKIGRLKNLLSINNGSDYKEFEVENSENSYPVYGSGGVFTYSSKYIYDQESVLLGRKGTINKPLYVTSPFWAVDTMFYSQVKQGVHGKYVYYQALGFPYDRYSSNTALPSMTQTDLLNLSVAIPIISEQIEITQFLDNENTMFDNLISKQKTLIEKLKEYRASIISHAVTGKIDVREFGA